MLEAFYDKINDYSSVSIKLASPEVIRSWSSGEVKKAETINYRTFKPEKDGLFCEKIFGPERDWECSCGKYRGIKYKGITCDRCGVEVTSSRERRRRMGHINLASPCVHIWYFKNLPSVIGTLLGLKNALLEKVIYYQNYIVTDVFDSKCGLKEGMVLTEADYNIRVKEYPNCFEASMGGEAIKKLLSKIDLIKTAEELRKQLKESRSLMKTKELLRHLSLVEKFIESNTRPEWMVLEVLPVAPAGIRPLVLLDNGTLATSDLNDLYRRVINRNNRLKRLLQLNAPNIIIQNEKRMLQQAVDNLLYNTKAKYQIMGNQGQPLKSLTGLIKGKQGRFRENLLGKRVDYSARSVIVVGPELKLTECGLPKKIALEIYQPFIIRELKAQGIVDTIKTAKKLIEQKSEVVYKVLEKVVRERPVLLNRAPTLHRLGIQAFQPVLIEEDAIQLHPLVCTGFNADFDGDQMAVHVPLTDEALMEAKNLLMSNLNCFLPRDGSVISLPTQDIILGINYITLKKSEEDLKPKQILYSVDEAILSYEHGKLKIHDVVELYIGQNRMVKDEKGTFQPKNGRCVTTVGRAIFNSILPLKMPYYNLEINKKMIKEIIDDCYSIVGYTAMVSLLDDIKKLGFHYATISGLSLGVTDLCIPEQKKEIIEKTQLRVNEIKKAYEKGLITPNERYNQVVDLWIEATEKLGEILMDTLKNDKRDGVPYLNPLYIITNSGARGSKDQVKQLAAMRGLMTKPSGRIIETPIYSNFREGLSIQEYFNSTHGARKGLVDTALKTSEAGYLTRKLVDVAQGVVVTMVDCGTLNGITKNVIYRGDKVEVPLAERIYGRVARDAIVDVVTDEVIVKENELITKELAEKIEKLGFQKLRVRSPLTCEAPYGVCARCYGMDLSTRQMVELGTAVGIIAAQAIGEPGTQLTLRTFHIGGTAFRTIEESKTVSRNQGYVKLVNARLVVLPKGETFVSNRNAELLILDQRGRELEKHSIPMGSSLKVKDGEEVKAGQLLLEWDPHFTPIIADVSGIVKFRDIIENETMAKEYDSKLKVWRKVITEYKGNYHPQIIIQDKEGAILGVYLIPEKAYIEVNEDEDVQLGAILARIPREVKGTQDITGGLPRVTELFEARRPKDAAIISEIDGVVELYSKEKGKTTVIVRNPETGMEMKYLIPYGKFIRVRAGDKVSAGEPITDGSAVLHDILRTKGEEALQQYLLQEVQSVYRSQGININDKHIEIIIAQMLKKVKIHKPGDTGLLPGEVIDKSKFQEINAATAEKNGKVATAKPVLTGISKASLQSESFISAASFQETPRVLTEAAIAGKRDELIGLKENVILGHILPCGTGFKSHLKATLKKKIFAEEEVKETVG